MTGKELKPFGVRVQYLEKEHFFRANAENVGEAAQLAADAFKKMLGLSEDDPDGIVEVVSLENEDDRASWANEIPVESVLNCVGGLCLSSGSIS